VDIPAPWVVLHDNAKFMVLGAPEAIAGAAASRPSDETLRLSDGDQSVSAFWRPASDRTRFSVYGELGRLSPARYRRDAPVLVTPAATARPS